MRRTDLRLALGAAVLTLGWLTGAIGPPLRALAQAPAAPINPTRAEVVQMMKDISNWGRWGAADEIGTFNLITPAKRKEAAGLVREGLSVSLAHTVDKEVLADNPTPFKIEFRMRDGKMLQGGAMDVISSTYPTTTTHVDSLCHSIFEGKTDNGWEIAKYDQATPTREGLGEGPGCVKNSILGFKNGLVTRGVLVDIPLMRGVPYLEPGPWPAAREAAGFHVSVMPWFKRRDVTLISSDAVQDVQPSNIEGFPRPIHMLSINTLGMPMIDVADLEEAARVAARLKRWAFMLTVAALPAPGGSGSPVNPIATF